MINLRKNIFSSKVWPQNNQHVVLNIRDKCNINIYNSIYNHRDDAEEPAENPKHGFH